MFRLIEPEDLRVRGDFISPGASLAVLRGLISVDLAASQLSWSTPLLLDPWPGCAALVLIGPARGGLGLGLLVVGPKRAGGSLRRDDRMLLVTLAHQAGTALENAVLVAGLRTSLAQVEVSTKQLVAARAEQQLLLRELVNADERQRAALARDLHDDALQEVLYLIRHSRLCAELVTTLDTQTAPVESPPAQAALSGKRAPKNAALVRLTTELAQLAERAAVVEQRLRALCMGLYPALLHSLGLPAALDDLAKEHVPATGVRVSVNCPDDALDVAERLDPETALHMYRIAQEGLRNAGKHAGASEARVRLALTREPVATPPGHHASMRPALQLDIEDNGRGIPLPIDYAALLAAGHLGLAGIRERAQRIGGTLDVQRVVGGGVRIRLLVPVDSASIPPAPTETRSVQRAEGDH
jgi:signal transduction histidine kinase